MAELPLRPADVQPPYQCLIVDDVRSNHRLLTEWLTESGLCCDAVGDGRIAWEWLQTHRASLVVTDIEMPHCSGLELLQQIRSSPDPELANTPVLIMTSLDDRDVESAVQRMGGDGLLIKPLCKAVMLPMILEVVLSGVPSTAFLNPARQSTADDPARISPTLQRLLRQVASIERGR